MDVIYNHPKYKERRQALRKRMTPPEKMLWERLRNRRLDGIKFFRQYGVGRFILDFYCPKFRLGIELDGSSHSGDARIRDRERDDFLWSLDVRILRFWNSEIYQDIGSVTQKILEHCFSLERKGD